MDRDSISPMWDNVSCYAAFRLKRGWVGRAGNYWYSRTEEYWCLRCNMHEIPTVIISRGST